MKKVKLVPDWTNKNTITGETIFSTSRARKGTFLDPDKLMHDKINNKLTQ